MENPLYLIMIAFVSLHIQGINSVVLPNIVTKIITVRNLRHYKQNATRWRIYVVILLCCSILKPLKRFVSLLSVVPILCFSTILENK